MKLKSLLVLYDCYLSIVRVKQSKLAKLSKPKQSKAKQSQPIEAAAFAFAFPYFFLAFFFSSFGRRIFTRSARAAPPPFQCSAEPRDRPKLERVLTTRSY
jgi:hypothetical protein